MSGVVLGGRASPRTTTRPRTSPTRPTVVQEDP